MNHSFNIKIAELFGLEEAIMIENMFFWIKKNEANEKHFYDGKYWTYNSMRAFAQLFPYWSEKQVRRILKSLQDQGCVEVGNYNKLAYDRTKWYSLSQTVTCICLNGQMELPKRSNGLDQMGEPIPDINTDINTNINSLKNIKKENLIPKTRRKKRLLSEKQKIILKNKESFIKTVSDFFPTFKKDSKGIERLKIFYDKKILSKQSSETTKSNEEYFIKNLKAHFELTLGLYGDIKFVGSLKNYVGTDSEKSKNYHKENWVIKLEDFNNSQKNSKKSKKDATQHYAHSGNAAEEIKQAKEKARKLWEEQGIATEGFIFDL